MLAKAEQDVLILAIIIVTSLSGPVEVDQNLNLPLANTRTAFPHISVFTIEVSLTVIIPVSFLEVTILMAASEPFKVTTKDH